jgi:putative NADH-flavin reductase
MTQWQCKTGAIMKILVLGGTGATGKLAVQQLLKQGHEVVLLVRKGRGASITAHECLEVIEETVLSIKQQTLTALLASCDGVISCLGHSLTWRGVYGAPQMLVRDSMRRVCESLDPSRQQPMRLVLMNTTGNRNLDLSEPVAFAQHCVLALLRLFLPPHLDNERAANYLRTDQQANNSLTWVVVRPDGLIDEADVSAFSLHESPIRSAIFDAGKTSRMNVANFMARLLNEKQLWQRWQGKMPVIYNN